MGGDEGWEGHHGSVMHLTAVTIAIPLNPASHICKANLLFISHCGSSVFVIMLSQHKPNSSSPYIFIGQIKLSKYKNIVSRQPKSIHSSELISCSMQH